MSALQNAALWYQTQFAANVIKRWNETGYELKGATKPGEHLGADTYRFYLAKGGEANLRGAGGKYNYQRNENGFVDIKALTYDYPVKVLEDEVRRQSVFSVDNQSEMAATGCRKRANRVIINAMQAAVVPNANLLGAFAGDFRASLCFQVRSRMDALGVPNDGRRFCILRADWWSILSMAEVFSNSQYTGPAMPLMRPGDNIRTWLGINWMYFPDDMMPTTGSAVANQTFNQEGYGFAWHADALGSATIENGDIRTVMKVLGDEPAYSLVSEFDMATAALQTDGILQLRAKSLSAYPTNSTTL